MNSQVDSQNSARPPRVFISYSHDTSDHKRWVAELSTRLVSNGIDVVLDQWDLSLGDDLPKFMEKSVSESDRVLMICSEQYVVKADGGSGGVGYEAMVVTGELVRDLGTSKFIPILRQPNGGRIMPKSISTRFYVDLSKDDEEQFEQLLRELHKAPLATKPPIGTNPFAQSPSGIEIAVQYSPKINEKSLVDTISFYQTAKEVVMADDILKWREIVRLARSPIPSKLSEWRRVNEAGPDTQDGLIATTLQGIDIFSPLICIAVAGVASGRKRYSNQGALLEEILHPKGWNRSGLTQIVYLPEAASFVYHSVHGAMCAYTDQIMNSIDLVRIFIQLPSMGKPDQVCKNHEIMGWATSLGHNAERSWETLYSLAGHYPWIKTIFGDEEEYQTALVAYYMALSINEYSILLKEDQELQIDEEAFCDVALGFLNSPDDIQRRAYRLLLQDKEGLRNIWKSLDIEDARFFSFWGKWVNQCSKWPKRGGGLGYRGNIVFEKFDREFLVN